MLVTIATFSFPHEAYIARMRLEAMDIPSFLADEHTVGVYWLYSNAIGGVRLQVPAAFAAQAQKALNEPVEITSIPDTEIEIEPEPAVCPYCGGVLGQPYTAGKRIAFAIWAFFTTPLWPIRQVCKCTVCGKTTKYPLR